MALKRYSTRREQLGSMAELNVTPLLDLAFVLLVIFMITAPFLKQGLEISVPTTENAQAEYPEDVVTLRLNAAGELALDATPLPMAELSAALARLKVERPDVAVILEAESSLPVQSLVGLLEKVKAAGVAKVGIATRPRP